MDSKNEWGLWCNFCRADSESLTYTLLKKKCLCMLCWLVGLDCGTNWPYVRGVRGGGILGCTSLVWDGSKCWKSDARRTQLPTKQNMNLSGRHWLSFLKLMTAPGLLFFQHILISHGYLRLNMSCQKTVHGQRNPSVVLLLLFGPTRCHYSSTW